MGEDWIGLDWGRGVCTVVRKRTLCARIGASKDKKKGKAG